jgi:hypothetical protein
MQLTMKLIVGNGIDSRGLDCTSKVHRPFAHGVGDPQPQEPIHVQVRIRQYADALPELRWTHAGRPNPGRLPVGMMLDCYL